MKLKIQTGWFAFNGICDWVYVELRKIIIEADAAPRVMYQEFLNRHHIDFTRCAIKSYIAFFVASVFLVSNMGLSIWASSVAVAWCFLWACLLVGNAWSFRVSVQRGYGNPGEYRISYALLRLIVFGAAFILVPPLFFEARFFLGISATFAFFFWVSGDYFKACHPAR